MCEPLKGKIKKGIDIVTAVGYTIKDFFNAKDVKSAVEFYKRYGRDPIKFEEMFENEFNNFCKDILKWKGEKLYYKDMAYIEGYYLMEFNDWFFNYCFEDAIE